MSPGSGSAAGYQTLSDENRNNYAGTAGQVSGIGSTMAGMGQNMAGQWNNRANNMYGLASGIASTPPKWYADRAAVTSNQAFDESKGVQDRALSRMGINPNSGRFVGLQTQWGLAKAAAEAGARTKGEQDAQEKAFEREKELAGMAQNGVGEGARLMASGAGQIGAAGTDYDKLAQEYDTLAGQKAKNDIALETSRKSESNAAQRKIDEMLKNLQPVPYGQIDPRTGKINFAPGTSPMYRGF